MKLNEILEKHQDKKFIKLAEPGSNGFLNVADLETFLSLDDTFLYYSDDEADFDSFDDFLDDFKEDFVDWLKANHKKDLETIKKSLTSKKSSFEIYSFNHRVKFTFNDEVEDNVEEQIKLFVPEYQEFLEKLEEERYNKIEEYIQSFKEEYSKATKVKDKDDIIKQIQAGLKTTYKIDPRENPKYVAVNIREMLK